MAHPSGTRGLSHFLSVALAELDLHLVSLQYFGKANVDDDKTSIVAAHNECPISGIWRFLDLVFNLRQGCSIKSMWGVSAEI